MSKNFFEKKNLSFLVWYLPMPHDNFQQREKKKNKKQKKPLKLRDRGQKIIS